MIMQPQLTTREGTVIPLTDDIYEQILQLVHEHDDEEPRALSLEQVEEEFADLFGGFGSTQELLEEKKRELELEDRKLERFS